MRHLMFKLKFFMHETFASFYLHFYKFNIINHFIKLAELLNDNDINNVKKNNDWNKNEYSLIINLIYFSKYINSITANITISEDFYIKLNLSIKDRIKIFKKLNVIITRYIEFNEYYFMRQNFESTKKELQLNYAFSSESIVSVSRLYGYVNKIWLDLAITNEDLEFISNDNSAETIDFCKEYIKLYLNTCLYNSDNEFPIHKKKSLFLKILPHIGLLFFDMNNSFQLAAALLNPAIKKEYSDLRALVPVCEYIAKCNGVIYLNSLYKLLQVNNVHEILTHDEVSFLLNYINSSQLRQVFVDIENHEELFNLIKTNILKSTKRYGLKSLYNGLFKTNQSMFMQPKADMEIMCKNLNHLAIEVNKLKNFTKKNNSLMKVCFVRVSSNIFAPISFAPTIKITINKNYSINYSPLK